MPIIAIVALAAGTYLIRIAGPALAGRISLPARAHWLLERIAVVLIIALVASQTFIEHAGFAGWARITGVATGCILAVVPVPRRIDRALRRAMCRKPRAESAPRQNVPLPIVVIAAAAVAALLRLAGVR